jgi:hypothetical protein
MDNGPETFRAQRTYYNDALKGENLRMFRLLQLPEKLGEIINICET